MTHPHSQPPDTSDERGKIVARLSELYAKQKSATGWGAAVGARQEEILSLESRLLCIDAAEPKPADTQEPPPYYQDRPDLGPLGVTCNGYPILKKTNYPRG